MSDIILPGKGLIGPDGQALAPPPKSQAEITSELTDAALTNNPTLAINHVRMFFPNGRFGLFATRTAVQNCS